MAVHRLPVNTLEPVRAPLVFVDRSPSIGQYMVRQARVRSPACWVPVGPRWCIEEMARMLSQAK